VRMFLNGKDLGEIAQRKGKQLKVGYYKAGISLCICQEVTLSRSR
jgi:hypothetical protein